MKKDKIDALSLILGIDPLVFIYGTKELNTENEQINRDYFHSELNRLANLAETEEQKKQIIDFIKFVTKNDDK